MTADCRGTLRISHKLKVIEDRVEWTMKGEELRPRSQLRTRNEHVPFREQAQVRDIPREKLVTAEAAIKRERTMLLMTANKTIATYLRYLS